MGDKRGIASVLNILAGNALPQGRFEEAAELAREYLALQRSIGDQINLAKGLHYAGRRLIWSGEFAEGAALLEEAFPVLIQIRSATMHLAEIYTWLGYARCHLGEYEQAVAQIEQGIALYPEKGYDIDIIGQWFRGQALLVLEAYGEAQEQLELAENLYRREGRPNELGLVLGSLGHVACRMGDTPHARRYLREALQIAVEVRAFMPLSAVLPVASLLYAGRGEGERGLELYALLSRYPPMAKSRWFYDVAGHQLEAVAASLPPAVVAAARERGRALDLWVTAGELLAEFGEDMAQEGNTA